jgi:hypothetical protein
MNSKGGKSIKIECRSWQEQYKPERQWNSWNYVQWIYSRAESHHIDNDNSKLVVAPHK